ncbi:MAG: hypothetical protein ACREBC_30205, partial [Pyrinomonadaceae bacterium]
MTLATIFDKIKAAMDKAKAEEPDDTKRRVNITAETIDDECFRHMLTLLGTRDAGIIFSGAVKLDPNDKAKIARTLAIEGKAGILDRDSDTKIMFTDDTTTRSCVVEVKSVGPVKPGDLAPQEPFPKIGSIELPLFDSTVTVLDNPKVELTNLGFVLESFLGGVLKRPDTRFKVTGTFKVGKLNVSGEVELPVARTRGSDHWRVTVDAGGTTHAITPAQVGEWVMSGAEAGTEIFKEIPAEIMALGGFGLKTLRIDFDGRLRSVGAVQVVVVSTPPETEWKFADKLSLRDIA